MEILVNGGQHFNDLLLQYIKEKNEQVFSILQNANPTQLTDGSGSTLLHIAASYDNVSLTRYLIGLGANIEAKNNQMNTPLMVAVNNRKIKTVEVLLEFNADIFVPDKLGHCALKKALMIRNRHDIFTFIRDQITSESVRKSKHVENPNFHNQFPLYDFMSLKNVDVLRALLEKGSPVDAKKANTGDTSLHMAVYQMNLEKARLLVEYNADVNAKNNKGQVPLVCLVDFSDENKAAAMAKILMAAGASLIDNDNCEIIVSFLLQYGPKNVIRCVLEFLKENLHFIDNKLGWSILHYLARNKNPGTVAELSKYDFDIDIRTRKLQWTMLHFAVRARNVDSIKFLIDRGANIDATCDHGLTPLNYIILNHREAIASLNIHMACIEILLAHNANPRLMNESNYWHLQHLFIDPPRSIVITMTRPIAVHLALIEATDQEVGQYNYNDILIIPELKRVFKEKKLGHENMRQIELAESVSLLDFLSATDQAISSYAQKWKLISITNSAMKNYKLDPCYDLKLQESFLKFTKLVELRRKAATNLDKIFSEIYNISVYNVAQKIIEYLDDLYVKKLV